MNKKKEILVVTNAITEMEVSQIESAFKTHSEDRALDINISLVHVIPHLPTYYFNLPSMNLLVERYYDEAKAALQTVGRQLGVHRKDQWLITGQIRTEVLRLANRLNSSFILASAKQIQELQHSLFFTNIHQYAFIKTVNQLKQL